MSKQAKRFSEVQVTLSGSKNTVWWAIRAEAIARQQQIDARKARLAAVSAKWNALASR